MSAVHLWVYFGEPTSNNSTQPTKKAMTMTQIKFALFVALLLSLTACGSNLPATPTATLVDIPALQTSVYYTMIAQINLTATALAPTATPTPTATLLLPTATVTPTFTLEPTATQPWDVPLGSADRKLYVGREVPPYPPGYPRTAGWLLENEDYALETYQTQDGSQALIFLERYLYRDSQGKAHWRIVDAVILNDIPAGEDLVSDCSVNDVFRNDLIALGTNDLSSDPVRLIIDQIWQVSIGRERLEKLRSDKYECILIPMG
jgi:hypothetical protein